MTERLRMEVPRAGGLSVFRARREPVAGAPAPGSVRVDVAAAGVNYADCMVRRGLYGSAKELVGWPIVPGFEVGGTVGAAAPGTGFEAGDEVLAVTLFDGYTTHLEVPAHQVFRRPEGMSAVEGAAFPTVFLTAWYALRELAHLRRGQRVLIHSAAGGVGTAAVQLAVHHGGRVTGVVGGSHKVGEVEALGAEHVIDKSREDLWRRAEAIAPDGFDVVLDANGPSTLGASYAHLRRPGKLVVYGFASFVPRSGEPMNWLRAAVLWLRQPRFDPMELTEQCKSVLCFNLSYLFGERELLAEAMAELLAGYAAGSFRLPTITTYPLLECGRAQGDLESGTTVGKLVLTPPTAGPAGGPFVP